MQFMHKNDPAASSLNHLPLNVGINYNPCPCSLQALMLENLQKSSSSHSGLQPNSQV